MGKARKRRTDCCPSAFYPFDSHTVQRRPDVWKQRLITSEASLVNESVVRRSPSSPFRTPPLGSLAIEFILERGGRLLEPIIVRILVPLVEAHADRVYGPNEPIGYELG